MNKTYRFVDAFQVIIINKKHIAFLFLLHNYCYIQYQSCTSKYTAHLSNIPQQNIKGILMLCNISGQSELPRDATLLGVRTDISCLSDPGLSGPEYGPGADSAAPWSLGKKCRKCMAWYPCTKIHWFTQRSQNN